MPRLLLVGRFLPVNRSVNHGIRLFVELALAAGFLVPVALGQKPGSAPPPSAPPSRSPSPATATATTQPVQSSQDRVMFLMGRVTTSDSTAVPNDAIVERICNGAVRQQVHAALNGQFSMQLGSQNDSMLDATGDPASRGAVNSQNSETGISRQALANC